ncbi:HAD family hydrolase [Deinococcus sp. Marseille-Q6407]|uniref:HAD family hydrolase n=1 Tax=Deinococcus sp. Marseille-Q6407 TaxID=2969223 RepID=UPI0021BE355B|nr:HAD family hydrolase [Deinococcus sp. Marseille-Q6407]
MQLKPQDASLPTIDDLQALLVDLDGTLVGSNDAHARAWVQSLADQGIAREESEVRPLIGMGGDQLVPELTGESDQSELGKTLTQGWQDHFKPMIADLPVLPGARALLEWAREQGLPVVLASSGEDEIVDALLDHAGLSNLISQRVRSDEAEASKPEPDILQAALDKAGLRPDQTLFVGDTRFDAEAAAKAGVPCVLLRAGGSPDLEGAAYVLDDANLLVEKLRAAAQN